MLRQYESADVARGVGSAPPSDHDLLRRCRGHDMEAWDLLVARYERLIFSVALRNGLSRDDAADVTQTTFLAMLESLGALRQDERLPFWLMTVARREAWRLRRRRQRDLASDGAKSLAVSALPTDAIGDWERVAVVHEAVESLASPCRELILAMFFDATAPSYSTIAKQLGRSVGSLGPMRARCLARVRQSLGEDAHT